MENILKYLFLVLIFVSCLSANNNTNSIRNQDVNSPYSISINDYLKLNLPHCTVIDSLELKSLSSTLYSVDDINALDEDDYVIIMDQLTGQFYNIVRHHWPSFNRRLSQDLQIMVLKSDSAGQIIKPVNYDFMGLESFLNTCKVLEKKDINLNVLDTIFRFYENEFIRLTESTQVDQILDRRISNVVDDKVNFEKYIEAKRLILKEKIKRNNVFLYSLPYGWQEFIAYFELNPGVSIYCFDITPDAISELQTNKIFFKSQLHGNDFNLVYLWIE